MDDVYFMGEALEQARLALAVNDVPIGCVIVHENKIIGKGYNQRIFKKNALCHAEMLAIAEACAFIGDWRLEHTTLYVTVEPCPMCAGAIVQARIGTVVFGAANKKAGCGGSVMNILNHPGFNHRTTVVPGVMAEACGEMMRAYFSALRQKTDG